MTPSLLVIDNFLPADTFKHLQDVMTGPRFPWYLSKETDYEGDGNYQFGYIFFDDHDWYGDKQLILPFLEVIKPVAVRRIKANLQPPTSDIKTNQFHVDFHKPDDAVITTAVFYVNDNDGKTIFETGEEVASVANRMVMFDGRLRHTGTTCTGNFPRIVINFNFVAK